MFTWNWFRRRKCHFPGMSRCRLFACVWKRSTLVYFVRWKFSNIFKSNVKIRNLRDLDSLLETWEGDLDMSKLDLHYFSKICPLIASFFDGEWTCFHPLEAILFSEWERGLFVALGTMLSPDPRCWSLLYHAPNVIRNRAPSLPVLIDKKRVWTVQGTFILKCISCALIQFNISVKLFGGGGVWTGTPNAG